MFVCVESTVEIILLRFWSLSMVLSPYEIKNKTNQLRTNQMRHFSPPLRKYLTSDGAGSSLVRIRGNPSTCDIRKKGKTCSTFEVRMARNLLHYVSAKHIHTMYHRRTAEGARRSALLHLSLWMIQGSDCSATK
jgi:hypothetical protein